MPRKREPFSECEADMVRTMYGQGCDDKAIAEALNELVPPALGKRTRYMVMDYRVRIGLTVTAARRREIIRRAQTRSPTAVKGSDGEHRARAMWGDLVFKRAMLAALKAGLEDAPIGVVKDYRRFAGVTLVPAMVSSFGASPAAACADMGELRRPG